MLNPEQLSYVNETEHCCTTISIPGSGKSTVAVEKVAKLIEGNGHVKVLCVTFTAAAAAELVEKLAEKISPTRLNCCHAATFHSIAFAHLKLHGHLSGYRLYDVLIGDDRNQYANEAVELTGFRVGKLTAMKVIENALARMPCEWTSAESKLIDRYRDRLAQNNSTDFGLVLLDLVDGIAQGKLPLLEINHMIVDEAQDVDKVQLEFALLHARAGVIVDLIGDDDQSIYGFKCGLGYRALTEFTIQTSARVIKFRENHRSKQEILDAAATVIKNVHESRRAEKELYAKRGYGGVVQLNSFEERYEEMTWVANAIKVELFDDTGKRKTDPNTGQPLSVCVLASTHAILDLVEGACKAHSDVFGVQRTSRKSIWENPTMKRFIKMLKALMSTVDDAGMDLALKWAGLSVVVREELRSVGGTQKAAISRQILPSVELPESGLHALESLMENWGQWRNFARSADPTIVVKLLNEVKSWMIQFKCPRGSNKEQDFVETLLGIGVSVIVKLSGSLKDRLDFLEKKEEAADSENCVQLLTLHGSKGLQFNTTIIVAVEDDVIPGKDGKDIGLREEWVRLLYVGMTRARDRLMMTCRTSRFHYGYHVGERYEVVRKNMSFSPFLKEFADQFGCEASGS